MVVSEEEYLDFKIGDKYYWSASKSGYATIMTQREADLANRKIPSKYYLEYQGGKCLVTFKNAQ